MRLENLVFALAALTVTLVNGMTLTHNRQKRQNYDALLQNKAFVESQLNCVLRRGQCDRIGNRIKILVPEVVKTKECKSCTEDEKGNVQKVADHVQSNYPKEWNEIREQYTEDEAAAAAEAESEENDAESEGGEVEVETGSETSNDSADISGSEVADSGSGITPESEDGVEGDGQNALVPTALTKSNQTEEIEPIKTQETPIKVE